MSNPYRLTFTRDERTLREALRVLRSKAHQADQVRELHLKFGNRTVETTEQQLNVDYCLRLIIETCPAIDTLRVQTIRSRYLGPGLLRALSGLPNLRTLHFQGKTSADGQNTDMSILRRLVAAIPQITRLSLENMHDRISPIILPPNDDDTSLLSCSITHLVLRNCTLGRTLSWLASMSSNTLTYLIFDVNLQSESLALEFFRLAGDRIQTLDLTSYKRVDGDVASVGLLPAILACCIDLISLKVSNGWSAPQSITEILDIDSQPSLRKTSITRNIANLHRASLPRSTQFLKKIKSVAYSPQAEINSILEIGDLKIACAQRDVKLEVPAPFTPTVVKFAGSA